jgi:hypothetical protein
MTMFASAGKVGSLRAPAGDMAGWLGLAAAPTFAWMAGISAAGSPDTMMCAAVPAFLPINDMALMYLLMSLFHLSPWLKFLSGRLHRRSAPTARTEGD